MVSDITKIQEFLKDEYQETTISFSDRDEYMVTFWYPLVHLKKFIEWSKVLATEFIVDLPFGSWILVNLQGKGPIKLGYWFKQTTKKPTNDEVNLAFEIIRKNTDRLHHHLKTYPRKKLKQLLTSIKAKELVVQRYILRPPSNAKTTLYHYFCRRKFNFDIDLNLDYFLETMEMEQSNFREMVDEKWKMTITSFAIEVHEGKIKPIIRFRQIGDETFSPSLNSPFLTKVGKQKFHSGQFYKFDGSKYNNSNWDGHEKTLLRLRHIMPHITSIK